MFVVKTARKGTEYDTAAKPIRRKQDTPNDAQRPCVIYTHPHPGETTKPSTTAKTTHPRQPGLYPRPLR